MVKTDPKVLFSPSSSSRRVGVPPFEGATPVEAEPHPALPEDGEGKEGHVLLPPRLRGGSGWGLFQGTMLAETEPHPIPREDREGEQGRAQPKISDVIVLNQPLANVA